MYDSVGQLLRYILKKMNIEGDGKTPENMNTNSPFPVEADAT
jgi:hypothetical protein